MFFWATKKCLTTIKSTGVFAYRSALSMLFLCELPGIHTLMFIYCAHARTQKVISVSREVPAHMLTTESCFKVAFTTVLSQCKYFKFSCTFDVQSQRERGRQGWVLTRGTTLAKTANRPAVGHLHRVTFDGRVDRSSTNWQAVTSHWLLASLAAVAHVTFQVPLTSWVGGNLSLNSISMTMVSFCLRTRRPSCATFMATIGVITLYSVSPSLLKTRQYRAK